ncbi:MAG TPA: FtsX-like permease family protein [Candidatus Binataceae bacterium]|jgi:putative ABC transport system permease protein
MKALRQIVAVSSINLRSVPRRATASLVIVGSTAGVVAVLISVLAMGLGFAHTVAGTGRADRAIIVSAEAEDEATSSISREAAARIVTAPGIRHIASGDPIADAELLVQFQVPRKTNHKPVDVALRGVGKLAFALRPEIRLVKGRVFRPGLHEFIVGRSAQAQYADLDIGDRVPFPDGDWSMVGVFESHGASSLDSGALGDADTVMAAFQHNWFNSVTAHLDGPESLDRLKRALAADPTLHVQVRRESEYFISQSRPLNVLLEFVGYFVGSMMAVGAVFSALNTMYSAVSSRAQEIATLRAIGFGGGPVAMSVLVEALVLAIAGAMIGSLLAWALFNGHVISMSPNTMATQTAFALAVTPGLIGLGIIWAVVIGGIGGLFPALRAARMPVARVLTAAVR